LAGHKIDALAFESEREWRERERKREKERERESGGEAGGGRAAISTERSIFSIRSSGVVLVIIAADADAVILLFVRSRLKLPKTLPTLSLSLSA
jgi:hypothetical protein